MSESESSVVTELIQLRDHLRTRYEQRNRDRGKDAMPLEFFLHIDRGVAGRGMQLHLLWQDALWHVTGMEPSRRDPQSLHVADVDLSHSSGVVSGRVVLGWTVTEDEDAGVEAVSVASRSQVFEIRTVIRPVEETLRIRMKGVQGSADWELAYRRTAQGWTFCRDIEAPPAFASRSWGPFERVVPDIQTSPDGYFSTQIKLHYCGEEKRLIEAYAGKPVTIDMEGHLIDGRIATRYQQQAPGGKHVLNANNDHCTGMVQSHWLEGTYHAHGDQGEWTGEVSGPGGRFPQGLQAVDLIAVSGTSEVSFASGLYHQIRALGLLLREEYLSPAIAVRATTVPEPVLPDMDLKVLDTYAEQLLQQAQRIAGSGRDTFLFNGAMLPPYPQFGPYQPKTGSVFGKADATLPFAGDKPVWHVVQSWQALGPFALYHHEIPVLTPEIPQIEAGYRRVREFDAPWLAGDRALPLVEDIVFWKDLVVPDGWVALPDDEASSSGSMRYFVWYAKTVIEVEEAQDIWMAAEVAGQLALWINGEPVWTSGHEYHEVTPSVFPVRLQQGRNYVLARCASSPVSNDHFDQILWFDGFSTRPQGRVSFTGFKLHVNSTGPGSASEFMASQPTEAEGMVRRYSDADPPFAWDLQRGINVEWSVPLYSGFAAPAVTEDQVLVTEAPDFLLALDLKTGRERWRQQASGENPSVEDSAGDPHEVWTSPVVAHNRVWAAFENGFVICCTLDGDLIWRVDTGQRWSQPNIGQPLLVEELLVLQEHRGDGASGRFALRALDRDTGRLRWQSPPVERRVLTRHDRSEGLGNGFARMSLQQQGDVRHLLLTGDGVVLCGTTGRVLFPDILGLEGNRAPPYVVGNRAYFATVLGVEAVEFWLDANGEPSARCLYRQRRRSGRGQAKTVTQWGARHWMPAPIAADGRLYVSRVDTAHVPQHYPVPWHEITVNDLALGHKIQRMRAAMRDCTDPTIAPVIAGLYLFASEGGAPVPGFHGTTDYGEIAAIRLGDQPLIVGRSRTGARRAVPVAHGKRLFVRDIDRIYSLKVQDEPGALFQEQVLAATVINEIGPRPRAESVRDALSLSGRAGETHPALSFLRERRLPQQWLVTTILPAKHQQETTALWQQPDFLPEPDEPVAWNGSTLIFRELDAKHVLNGKALDLVGAAGGESNCTIVFFTLLESAETAIYRFHCRGTGYHAFLAGEKLAERQLVRLPLGRYPLVITVDIGRIPPFAQKIAIEPFFRKTEDPQVRYAAWRQQVQAYEELLRRIVTVREDSDDARTAQSMLDHLREE